MILFVSGATKTIEKYRGNPYLGCFLTPRTGNSENSRRNCLWAADNAAFSNFNEHSFIKMLERIKGSDCKFVACPDKVCDGQETIKLFYEWQSIIRKYNLPVALVIQNGMKLSDIPFNMIDAIFIGGDNEFKLGPDAREITEQAKLLGKWIHMGRVNTNKRLKYAFEIGCDSVDGSGYSMFPEIMIPRALKFLDQIHSQVSLW